MSPLPIFPTRLPLIFAPTPLEPLHRLSRHLGGPELWVKRDDLTGLGFGGNKSRKLEFLLAEAKAQGCDHVVTMGARQSNHCRQTAAACAKVGMGCSLVLRGAPPPQLQGNLLLDKLLGAYLHWSGNDPLPQVANQLLGQLRGIGRTPYLIPYGGSNVVGATGYVWAMQELKQQLDALQQQFDFILFASSSGGTQAGLLLGAHLFGLPSRILGISVENSAETVKTHVAALTTATATHLGLNTLSLAQHVEVNDDYCLAGYGVVTELEREAIQLTAQMEGILLDPVYTGRAMGALIDLIRWGAFTRRQKLLFWHTGGTPALFAYHQELL